MVAFAVEWLTKLFGSDVGGRGEEIQRDALECRAVRAGRDVGGQRPAGSPSRKVLTEPFGCMYSRRRSHA